MVQMILMTDQERANEAAALGLRALAGLEPSLIALAEPGAEEAAVKDGFARLRGPRKPTLGNVIGAIAVGSASAVVAGDEPDGTLDQTDLAYWDQEDEPSPRPAVEVVIVCDATTRIRWLSTDRQIPQGELPMPERQTYSALASSRRRPPSAGAARAAEARKEATRVHRTATTVRRDLEPRLRGLSGVIVSSDAVLDTDWVMPAAATSAGETAVQESAPERVAEAKAQAACWQEVATALQKPAEQAMQQLQRTWPALTHGQHSPARAAAMVHAAAVVHNFLLDLKAGAKAAAAAPASASARRIDAEAVGALKAIPEPWQAAFASVANAQLRRRLRTAYGLLNDSA